MIDQRSNSSEKSYNVVHPLTRQILKKVTEPIILSPL